MAEATNTTNPPLHGMSVEEIEAAIKKHWIYADFYLAEILAGESTIEDTARDLQSLISAATDEGDQDEMKHIGPVANGIVRKLISQR